MCTYALFAWRISYLVNRVWTFCRNKIFGVFQDWFDQVSWQPWHRLWKQFELQLAFTGTYKSESPHLLHVLRSGELLLLWLCENTRRSWILLKCFEISLWQRLSWTGLFIRQIPLHNLPIRWWHRGQGVCSQVRGTEQFFRLVRI